MKNETVFGVVTGLFPRMPAIGIYVPRWLAGSKDSVFYFLQHNEPDVADVAVGDFVSAATTGTMMTKAKTPIEFQFIPGTLAKIDRIKYRENLGDIQFEQRNKTEGAQASHFIIDEIVDWGS